MGHGPTYVVWVNEDDIEPFMAEILGGLGMLQQVFTAGGGEGLLVILEVAVAAVPVLIVVEVVGEANLIGLGVLAQGAQDIISLLEVLLLGGTELIGDGTVEQGGPVLGEVVDDHALIGCTLNGILVLEVKREGDGRFIEVDELEVTKGFTGPVVVFVVVAVLAGYKVVFELFVNGQDRYLVGYRCQGYSVGMEHKAQGVQGCCLLPLGGFLFRGWGGLVFHGNMRL